MEPIAVWSVYLLFSLGFPGLFFAAMVISSWGRQR